MSRYFVSNQSIPVQQITDPATASGLAVSGRCIFYGIVVSTDGTNDVTVNVYDARSGSGTRLIPANVVITGSDKVVSLTYEPPIICTNGIYVTVSTSGTCSYQVLWDK